MCIISIYILLQLALLSQLTAFAFLVQLAGVVVIYYFTRDGQGT